MATNRQELITKLARRKSGETTVCDKCGEAIAKGDLYYRVETTKNNKGLIERGVKRLCNHHKVRIVCQIDGSGG